MSSAAQRVASPVFDAAIRDPIRGGRFRLAGVGGLERQLATTGLVALAGLLVSLLLGDVWRQTPLLFLTNLGGRPTFVPEVLYPVTLLGLAVAWLLLLWGAMWVSLPARLGVVALFVAVCSPLSRPLNIGSDRFLYRVGPTAALVIFWSLAGLVAAWTFVLRSERWSARLRPALFALLTAGILAFFALQVALYAAQSSDGLPVSGPTLLDSALRQVQSLLVPMVLVSALALVVFSFDLAAGVAAGTGALGATVARLVLAAVLGVKLWLQLFPVDSWWSYVEASPRTTIRVLGAAAFFAGVAYALRRWERRPGTAAAGQEGLLHGVSAALALPLLVIVAVVSFAQLLVVQFSATGAAASIIRELPDTRIVDVGPLLVAVAVLAAGLFLVRTRRRATVASEAGLGLALVGAWLLSVEILDELESGAGFRESLLDLSITLAVAAYALLRLWRLTGVEASALIGLTLFVWLFTLRGDLISFSGDSLGFPTAVVVVLGVVWTLLTSSSFVAGDSAAFPRRGRALLWLGYLLLAATILLWVDVTHGSDPASRYGELALIQLGVPIAAWLWIRRGFGPLR